ncbi:MAG: GNAT family N-acetyltransferase [Kutzneria sp.]|nr:GNAT family N-acetyltransferase [Kutzneria sp.]
MLSTLHRIGNSVVQGGAAGDTGQVTELSVRLRELDEHLLAELLATAVAEADPPEVMPPGDGPPGWTRQRQQAFLQFHRERSIGADTPVETTYAIELDSTVVGAARLEPVGTAVEAGIWIGRSWRGSGVGRAVIVELLAAARAIGAVRFIAVTTPGNLAARKLLASLGADVAVRDGDVVAELTL